jgi:hypothetical protein
VPTARVTVTLPVSRRTWFATGRLGGVHMRTVTVLVAASDTGAAANGCIPKETHVVQGSSLAEDKAGLWAK